MARAQRPCEGNIKSANGKKRCGLCPLLLCSLLPCCLFPSCMAMAQNNKEAAKTNSSNVDVTAGKTDDISTVPTGNYRKKNVFQEILPPEKVIELPKDSPLPPSGLPPTPWAGDPLSDIPMIDAYEASPNSHYKGHIDSLDAITNAEAFSALLTPEMDAQRHMDMEDPYFLPTAGLGNALPQIQPFREKLRRKGITFSVLYKGQLLGNFSGGRRGGADYINRVGFNFNFDLGKMFGFRNWSVHSVIMNKRGRPAAHDYVGEYMIPLQQNLNFTGPDGFRVTALYAERTLFNDRVDIAFGRMLFGHVFATSPLLCTFMTTCAAPAAVKANPRNPKGSWSARVIVRPTRDTNFMLGAFQAFPIAEDSSGWQWTQERDNTMALPIQFSWTPFFGRDRLAGRYTIGYLHNMQDEPDMLMGDKQIINKLWASTPGHHGTPKEHGPGNKKAMNEMWFEMEQMLYRRGGRDAMAGGYFLSGFVHNSGHTVPIQDQAYGGISLNGLIPGRTSDRLGILYSWYHISDRRRLGEQMAIADASADDLSTAMVLGGVYGQFGALGPKVRGPQTSTQIIETYYSVDAAPGIQVQPEFLYQIKPGETHRTPNSAMLGMKVMANL